MGIEDVRRMWTLGNKPSDPTEQLVWRFAGLANKSCLHALDWERFYAFVAVAHTRRKGWDHRDIEKRLLEYGFTPDKAKELSEVYWFGRCVLAVHRRSYRMGSAAYARWVRKGGTPLT